MPDDAEKTIVFGLLTSLLRYALLFPESELATEAAVLIYKVGKTHNIDPDSVVVTIADG